MWDIFSLRDRGRRLPRHKLLELVPQQTFVFSPLRTFSDRANSSIIRRLRVFPFLGAVLCLNPGLGVGTSRRAATQEKSSSHRANAHHRKCDSDRGDIFLLASMTKDGERGWLL